ncbi:MFS transporter [Fructilactobacillus myrtifloralis]|uniref:MFS transporter n=1 Tax=Fructilactobacillus myrtifloralis TaxID=2940301 RepID=A0ABY5BMQ7_9LACO|nr:MFS transporter [Fructilactobacillus myrtifloralis]USS84496.1 MFS transporter [Fructilactobacillus myrtifloralis]
MGERIGNKLAFQLSAIVFVIASLLGALAPNIYLLIIARALMGIGTGGMVAIPFIIYADLYPNPVERAKALTWVTASYGLSVILGPVIGGIIVDSFGWRWTFGINVPIGLLAIMLLQHFYLEQTPKKQKQPIDGYGISTLVIWLAMILFVTQTTLSIWSLLACLLVILGLGFLFWWIEGRSDNPIIPHVILENKFYMGKNLIMILFYGLFTAYSVYAPMWAQSILGKSATIGGSTMMLCSVALIIATQVVSRLMKFITFQRITALAAVNFLLAGILLSLLPMNVQLGLIIVGGIFIGIGQGLGMSPLQVAVQNDVDKKQINIATTFSLLARTLGQTLFVSIFGTMYVQQIRSGIKHNPKISMNLINQLGTPAVKEVPQSLLHQMRVIAFGGIQHIFMVATIGCLLALFINQFVWKKEIK